MPVKLIPQSHLPLRKRFLKEQSCPALLEENQESSFQEVNPAEDKTKCKSKVNLSVKVKVSMLASFNPEPKLDNKNAIT